MEEVGGAWASLYLYFLASAKMCSGFWVLAGLHGFKLASATMNDASSALWLETPGHISCCSGCLPWSQGFLNNFFLFPLSVLLTAASHLAGSPEAWWQKEFCGGQPPFSARNGKQAQFSMPATHPPAWQSIQPHLLATHEPLSSFSLSHQL